MNEPNETYSDGNNFIHQEYKTPEQPQGVVTKNLLNHRSTTMTQPFTPEPLNQQQTPPPIPQDAFPQDASSTVVMHGQPTPVKRSRRTAITIALIAAAITLAVVGAGLYLKQNSDPLTEYERVRLESDWAITPAKSRREVCESRQFGMVVLLLAFKEIRPETAETFWEEKCL